MAAAIRRRTRGRVPGATTLKPCGRGLEAACTLALRVGTFAHAIAWARQRQALPEPLPSFERGFAVVLRRALARSGDERR